MSDDREAVARFLRLRTEDAFLELYRRHTDVLFRLAMRLTADRARAEDVVQETWLRATTALPHFAWRSELRTWLCGFVVNCCRERRGEVHPRELDAVADLAPAGAGPERVIDLQRAVADLPDGYRNVLLLHDFYGYTHEEIAALLEVDSGTSKSQLHRARAAVRDSLGGKRDE